MGRIFLALFVLSAPALAANDRLDEEARVMRHLLRNVEGVTVSVQGRHLVVDGDVLTRDEMDRVLRVLDGFPEAMNLVTLHPATPPTLAKTMEDSVHSVRGCEDVSVDFINGVFNLSGTVPTEAHKRAAESAAMAYAPELQPSEAVKRGVLVQGAKKPFLRNLIRVVPR